MSKRNVVVVCLDTVRKDYFDAHAERLVSRADISFEQCRAPSSWTVPSHASFLTGELPHQHDAHAYNTTFAHLQPDETFIDDLPHRSIGVSANAYISSSFGIASLFDEFVDIAPSVVFPEGMYLKDFTSNRSGPGAYVDYAVQTLDHEAPLKSLINGVSYVVRQAIPNWLPHLNDDGGRAVTRAARRKVESTDEPYFLFLNLMEAHAPFALSLVHDQRYRTVPWGWSSDRMDIWDVNTGNIDTYREDIEHYRQLYAASIEYLDRLVNGLIDVITERSSHETTVVITSDHGENLVYPEDDNLIEHKGSLTEGLLHVPLYIFNPPQSFDASTDDLFSLLDLGPLVDRLVGGSTSFEYSERVPAELIGLGSADPELASEEVAYWDRTIRCAYNGNEKYLWDSTGNRYHETIDPDRACSRHRDTVDVDIPEWARSWFATDIDSHRQSTSTRSDTDVSAQTVDRLEDLGYL